MNKDKNVDSSKLHKAKWNFDETTVTVDIVRVFEKKIIRILTRYNIVGGAEGGPIFTKTTSHSWYFKSKLFHHQSYFSFLLKFYNIHNCTLSSAFLRRKDSKMTF